MKTQQHRASREQALVEVMAALTSSLDLTEAFSESQRILSRVLVADFGGLCVSRPGEPGQYDWPVVEGMPQVFFDRYPEISDACFVSRAVLQHPNTVLRDSEMLSRQAMRNSAMYAHCLEMNMRVERVMSVLLDVGLDWHSGFTLYREGRKPFSDPERTFLQRLTPMLARTIRNCRLMSDVAQQGDIMDTLFHHAGIESVVLSLPATELMRTPRSTELLQRWFKGAPVGRLGLPTVLLDNLERLVHAEGLGLSEQDLMVFRRPERTLKVTFVRLPVQAAKTPWALLLREVSHEVPAPMEWHQRLTPRELQVVERVLKGWDNLTIAEDLGSSMNTMKTHLKRIFVKLAVPSRSKLILLAQELNAGRPGPA